LKLHISAPNWDKTFLKKALKSSRQGLFKNISEIGVRPLATKLWSSTRRNLIAIFSVTMGPTDILKKVSCSSRRGLSQTFYANICKNAPYSRYFEKTHFALSKQITATNPLTFLFFTTVLAGWAHQQVGNLITLSMRLIWGFDH
jgi:hypothetical protein